MRSALLDRITRTKRVSSSLIPAPVEGWDTSQSLADMGKRRAITLDNFFPQSEHVELRRGHVSHANLVGVEDSVETLMAYHGAFTSRLFAAAGGNVYDVTVPIDGDITGTSLAGMGSGRFQHVNFTGTGGSFLWICNGVTAPYYFDGSDWTEAAITGVTPEAIVGVDVYKGRIWLVLEDSTTVAYLPVDSIQGVAETYELGGVMSKGGTIIAVATWSIDGGDGPDDQIVFVTSRGQVIVFTGLDPEDAANWTIVGVYDIGTPIGRRCVTKVGADLVVICVDGVKPLSQVAGLNRGAQAQASVSQRVSRAISDAARSYSSLFGWEMTIYPRGTAAILNVPIIERETSQQFVMNVNTRAWCRYTGQDASCWAVFNDRLFFGGKGMVYEADVGPSDVSGPIVADLKTSFQNSGGAGLKRYTMAQPYLNADEGIAIAIGVDTDFVDGRDLQPVPSTVREVSRWDQFLWDVDTWAQTVTQRSDWIPITGTGQTAAIRMRVQIDQTPSGMQASRSGSLFQVNGFNVTAERGDFL